MALALCLVVLFAAYSVLLGVCLARVRGLASEVQTLTTLVQTIATIQRDADAASPSLSDAANAVVSDMSAEEFLELVNASLDRKGE